MDHFPKLMNKDVGERKPRGAVKEEKHPKNTTGLQNLLREAETRHSWRRKCTRRGSVRDDRSIIMVLATCTSARSS